MTFKIPKSQIPAGFEVDVANFAKEMRDWRSQEKIATEHEGRSDLPHDQRYVHRKKPSASALVQQAVNESDVADYEIVDDGPTPEQILAARKNDLFNKILTMQNAAMNIVAPASKRPLWDIKERDIIAADDKVRISTLKAISKDGVISSALKAIGLKDSKPVDIEAAVLEARSPEDTAHLSAQNDRRSEIDRIHRLAAQAYSDIEDLTIANVDAWKIPDFTK